ncbi:YdcF family protein [Clostridium sp. YIM B02505]|uniref:YdcF family protein n=1 Tax=Clostridium yunnanense TaxID=2800325 RepID=A0ABS1EJ50_9CLOT|nr:YdcF family protein [Clostridium yunnanense]MBK1809390.1 YdcF family protein [Clostridium yunnanense]
MVNDSDVINNQIISDINKIGMFLAKRDLNQLSCEELHNKYGIMKADIILLLGNSITNTIEVVQRAFKDGIANKIMVVGGIGHSTSYLINNVEDNNEYQAIETRDKAEADIINNILINVYGISETDIIRENKSTNCGDNAYKAYDMLKALDIEAQSIILIQDPTMQLRSDASFRKVWRDEDKVKFINYAPFLPKVKLFNDQIKLENTNIEGIWKVDRYLSLIMGEIPRLKDDEYGYGPKGKYFIEHVDIPEEMIEAYLRIEPTLKKYLDMRKIV